MFKLSQDEGSNNNYINLNVIDFLFDLDVLDEYLKRKGINTKYINTRTLSIGGYFTFKTAKRIYDYYKDTSRRSINIEDDSKLFKPVLFYLINKINFFDQLNNVSFDIEKNKNGKVSVEGSSSSSRTFYTLQEEIQRIQIPKSFTKEITYDGVSILIDRLYEEKQYNKGQIRVKIESLNFDYDKKDHETVIEFFKDAIIFYYNEYLKKSKNISVYQSRSWGTWDEIIEDMNRPIESVFLDDDIKNNIINDIENFVKDREFFEEKGIPYKRNYLFHGTSGTGKTSFIKALGTLFKRDIYFLTFSDDMSSSDFTKLMNYIPSNSIAVFEDIDVLFNERESSDDNRITFNTFINALDGIITKNDVITMMTTNHRDKLDEALLRSGRIDVEQEFGNLTVDMAIDMICYLTDDINKSTITKKQVFQIKKYVKKDKKPSDLQKIILDNRDSDNILSNLN